MATRMRRQFKRALFVEPPGRPRVPVFNGFEWSEYHPPNTPNPYRN
jgi:hypothetical protein